jgi:hypothetical protein
VPKVSFGANAYRGRFPVGTIEILRQPTSGEAVIPDDSTSTSSFGMDVNVRNQAYTWGGAVAVVVNGRRWFALMQQSIRAFPCSKRPKPRLYTRVLPTFVSFNGRNGGRGCMRVSRLRAGEPWAVLFAFGRTCDLTP